MIRTLKAILLQFVHKIVNKKKTIKKTVIKEESNEYDDRHGENFP